MSWRPVVEGKRRWSVIEGDALRVAQRMPSGVADLVLVDPPYSSGGRTLSQKQRDPRDKYCNTKQAGCKLPTFYGEHRDQRSWTWWCTAWLSESYRLLGEGGHVVAFSDWRQLPSLTDAVQAAGFAWRGLLAWDKTRATRPRKGGFRQQCEFLVWATRGEYSCNRELYLDGCFRERIPVGQRFHVTQKPVGILRQLVQVARPEGLVVDLFTGSGSVLEAALAEGRRAIGVEFSPEYAAIARRRVRQAAVRIEKQRQVTEAA